MSGSVLVSGACFIHSDASSVCGQSGGRQLTEPETLTLNSETFLSLLSPVSADSHFSDSQHMALASVTACAGSDKS